MEENKRNWLRYLHDHISKKFDGRASQIRDILYRQDIAQLDCKNVYKNFDDAYPELLTLEEYTRERKINQILE